MYFKSKSPVNEILRRGLLSRLHAEEDEGAAKRYALFWRVSMIRFSDILRRVTGSSVPIFGIQWAPPPDEHRFAVRNHATAAVTRAMFEQSHRMGAAGKRGGEG